MISGNRLFFVCLLLLPLAARAQTDPALATVMNDLAAVRQSHANFTEEKYLSSLTEPLESKGTLTYSAPDRIEKITTEPAPESLIVTGDQLDIVHDGEAHTLSLSDHAEIKTFIESVRATLSGNLPALQQYYSVSFSGTPSSWQILLQPTDTGVQQVLTSIRIEGHNDLLSRVDMLSANGDRSDMTITPIAQ